MISIGIDVSKRKSTVAIINVMGEILQTPFDIEHSQIGLQKLWDLIEDYPKDQVKFIMEATGIYHLGLLNELQKQMLEVIKNGTNNTNTINSNNKTFNLQVFLNETCKNAMNIMDFVDSIKIQFVCIR